VIAVGLTADDRLLKFLTICLHQVILALFAHLTFAGDPAFSFLPYDFTDYNEKANPT